MYRKDNVLNMNKEYYIDIVNKKINNNNARNILINQIEEYYKIKDFAVPKHKYNVGDDVLLLKGTLLHGTYKNIEGLKSIAKEGLMSNYFVDGRSSKYLGSIGVWNLKDDILLKDYINLYSGGTIMYCGVYKEGVNTQTNKTDIIPYDKMKEINNITSNVECHMWVIEQTKEARFMPSLSQDRVQIGIIFNEKCVRSSNILNGDILNFDAINDEDVEQFVNPDYYKKFVIDRKNKDDLFTDRESAILFGIPANFIEGILVGRKYQQDNNILMEIKKLLPNAYICNLDGKVIVK